MDAMQQILTVKGGFYILKPDSGSEGAGIQLAEAEQVLEKSSAMTEGLRQAGKSGNVVVQHYIATPHLFSGGLKCMRLRLGDDTVPLQVYICKEGLVRFCANTARRARIHRRYDNAPDKLYIK